MGEKLRQPIVVVLGHVDSGKTSLLDKIRGTAVQAREFGGITQHIGASFFPIETLEKICGPLMDRFGGQVVIPGLLVIDTPGHAVFSNLRSRGGSASDISILVVDAMKGFEMQTYESLNILKRMKVPFIIALNKLDTVPGWREIEGMTLSKSLEKREKSVLDQLDNRIYEVIGALSRDGISSEAFYRLKDPKKQVAIVPVSAKTGEGIPELFSMLIGLTQQYLSDSLKVSRDRVRGIVLEVKDEIGLGPTANVVLVEGVMRIHDRVVVAKSYGPVVTKVKALFMPKPLDEMRDPRDKFMPVDEVVAAAGVKVSTPDLNDVLGGSPILGVKGDLSAEDEKKQVESEVKSLLIETDTVGVVVKVDALGSLEAIVEMLKEKGVPIRTADIGAVSKREIVKASLVSGNDRYLGVILAFGVKILDDAQGEAITKGVRIFSEPLLYDLIDKYTSWVKTEKEEIARTELDAITLPSKFKILKGMVFRRSNPAVFGVEVMIGSLQQKADVINSEGRTIGVVKQIQDKGQSIPSASQGSEVAVSVTGPIVGRTISEGEMLYTLPSQAGMRLLQETYSESISKGEQELLGEILAIRRKTSPLYGF